MAWYTSEENCTNRVEIPALWHHGLARGKDDVMQHLVRSIEQDTRSKNRACTVAIDGYKSANFEAIVSGVAALLTAKNIEVSLLNIDEAFKKPAELDRLVESSECPDDPSFGRVYPGVLEDFIDQEALQRLAASAQKTLQTNGQPRVIICYGMGATLADRALRFDRVGYLDVTREQLLIRSDRGDVSMLGGIKQQGFPWKRIYYVEYPVLNRHKKKVLREIDWYIDNSSLEDAILVPAEMYHAIITELSGQPISLKVFYMPGPFGGSEFGERFKVRGLPNTSWDYEISVGDNHMLVDVGQECVLDMPLYNLIWAQPLRVMGAWSWEKYPDHFPIGIYMQDGYFDPAEKVDFKRTHMPHHLHPDSEYCQQHFNEPMGRYETYYIVRADPGAVTMHGFRDDADIDAYIEEVKKSEETKQEFDWRKYIYEHPSTTGELHQLPPGTVHGTGGRQVILEIDTNPSRESTEYSFYLYDYCRPNFNYQTNELTGSPLKMTMEHSLATLQRNRRQDFMAEKCRPAPFTLREGTGWREVSFPMCDEMPYQVNRFEFSDRIEDHTNDLFHCLSLTLGSKVKVSSKQNPSKYFIMGDCDTIIIPACFGEYVCENLAGGTCEIVKTLMITDTAQ